MHIREIQLKDNDVYFMETMKEVIVINDNYEGIIVLDENLEIIEKIKLIDDMVIYSSYKTDDELLLYCSDNDCFIYINIRSMIFKIIPLRGFEDYRFSLLYNWDNDMVLLMDYSGCCVRVNLEKAYLEKANSDSMAYRMLKNYYAKLFDYMVYQINVNENKALVQITESKLGVFDYQNNLFTLTETDKKNYHSFELTENVVVKIGETEVEILSPLKQIRLQPSEKNMFLKGKIVLKGGETNLFLLSSDKRNPKLSQIEKYIF